MAHEVRAVVARRVKEPVEIVTIEVPDPGPGEALVRVQACAVCHTDLHYREGGINDEFPFLLGHEAAGVVEAVGAGVAGVEPGDFVVLNWRAVCGTCRSCLRGRPYYCFSSLNAAQPMTLDGQALPPALGIGAFAEKTLVAAGQCTRVDRAADAAVAGLLGCGVMAGIGAAIRTGEVQPGDSVAVFGCGGVGNAAAIAGARLRAPRRSSGSTWTPASSNGPVSWGRPTPSTPGPRTRSRRSGPNRRQRRRRLHRGGRQPQGLRAGLLRPRPGRDARPGRRPDAGDAPRAPHDRFLQPGRKAEAELVRRLPAQPRLPAPRRPLPPGPAPSRRVRQRTDRPGPGGGGLPQDGAGRCPPLGVVL